MVRKTNVLVVTVAALWPELDVSEAFLSSGASSVVWRSSSLRASSSASRMHLHIYCFPVQRRRRSRELPPPHSSGTHFTARSHRSSFCMSAGEVASQRSESCSAKDIDILKSMLTRRLMLLYQDKKGYRQGLPLSIPVLQSRYAGTPALRYAGTPAPMVQGASFHIM